jgi:hypothetical protein
MSDEALPLKWPVFDDYKIHDQRLRPILKDPNDPDITFYAPGGREELPGEIAKLERNDQPAVLAFARRYGLLGFSELSENKAQQPYGDPLNWLWLHAETLDLCLSLKEMLDSKATERLNRRLQAFPQARTQATYPAPCVTFASRAKTQQSSFFPPSGPNRAAVLQSLAANILGTIVNANITQLHPVLAWGSMRQMFVQQFQFTALVEVAYWHIANVLRGGKVTRCALPGCRGIFIQTDRRQRFCPTGTKQESPCAVRGRVQKFRSQALKGTQKKRGKRHGTKTRQR